ncbi:aklavinone 12-hydroxylase [Rhizobiales bacterium GAS113]|nr:aklavinone 12-hydroxylase [Rhizobiales bacterium GAS113]
MSDRTPSVLIIGAGLAGLTAAATLAWRGLRPLLVERHASTSQHPRARSVNFRSMELLRLMGLEDELVAAGGNSMQDFKIVIAESVTGREIKTILPRGAWDTAPFSPARASGAGQDRIEPILRRYAEEHGAQIRVSTELVSLSEDEDGVEALIRDRLSGAEERIRADYVVAADGNRSLVRNLLGIGLNGQGTLSHNMAVVFSADDLPLSQQGMVLYYLQNPGFTGVYISPDLDGRALVSVEYDPARESREDFTKARCVALIRAALGADQVEPRIIEVIAWEMASQVANRFGTRRVFLAGDAAHTMPPTGGLGGQTAIQDGFDIAWKLAMVLKGEAGSDLLATYAQERQPVGERTVALQTATYAARMRPDRKDLGGENAEADYFGVAFGYRYRSAAILQDGPDDCASSENPMQPSGRPGTRAAHLVLETDGKLVSTLDLIQSGFALLVGPQAQGFEKAGRELAMELPVSVYRIGTDLIECEASFTANFGVGPQGAVLLRPDGFIAWRSVGAVEDATDVLTQALARVLCRPIDRQLLNGVGFDRVGLDRPHLGELQRGAA